MTVKTLTGMATDVYPRENCIAPAIALIVWTTNTKVALCCESLALCLLTQSANVEDCSRFMVKGIVEGGTAGRDAARVPGRGGLPTCAGGCTRGLSATGEAFVGSARRRVQIG